MADYAKEGGHFYKRNGEPAYTYLNAKGEEKNTTLREARKFGWYPSVTQIIRLASAPGLEMWKQEQTILACLTLPKIEGESETDFIKRLREDAKAQAKQAAEKGTEIHGYIERGFRGEILPDETGYMYFDSVANTIFNECGRQESWSTEKSFASSLGFGGKIDLHKDKYLIDFKGTDKPLESLKVWDEQCQQLAAYDQGLCYDGYSLGVFRKCGICYVHRDTAESRLIWIEDKELIKGWKCFVALLDFWYAKTGLER
jgi:hypothetical protein